MDENNYIKNFTEPILECLSYKPKLGNSQKKEGVSVQEFLALYGGDPFYSAIGLDSPYMYAAHKAAGGMTSIYRQIGTGCEKLFRQILFDVTGYTDYSSSLWSYKTRSGSGKEKTLYLDGRLEISDINNLKIRDNVASWIDGYCRHLLIEGKGIRGAVFEVRQGYKSKDSKRQNGDLDNATVAFAYSYLPIFTIF